MKRSRETGSAGKRRSRKGRARPICLSEELSASLEATARARGMTVEQALLAAVGEWLGRALVRRRGAARARLKLRVIPGRPSLPRAEE